MKHIEDREQIALMNFIRLRSNLHPQLRSVIHIPNGGRRDPKTAVRLKQSGVRAGVWDIFVPIPAPGLWIEMKIKPNRLTPTQREWRNELVPYGYKFRICYTWMEAADAILAHVGMSPEFHTESEEIE